MDCTVKIGNKIIGEGQPIYIIGEIGLNHNGDIDIAKKLIDVACVAGIDAVKFQKRTPDIVVPKKQRDIPRETPWGLISYIEYRHKIEFWEEEYREIDRYCREREIQWFASVWDEKSVDFMEPFDPICYKIPSPCATDKNLLKYVRKTQRPIILSTGMSTMEQITEAVNILGEKDLVILHCTSTYPAKAEEINLRMIQTLKNHFKTPIGYSGHEVGLQISLAAAALGATVIERHITLDRAMWGSDHAASVEPGGLMRLIRDIHIISKALGDGKKKVYDSEIALMRRVKRY